MIVSVIKSFWGQSDISLKIRVHLAAFLKAQGHDVTAIAHDYLHALKDQDVLAIAQQEQRILITNARDFGELMIRQQLAHAGVILFRLRAEDLPTKQRWLTYVLTHHANDLHNLIVITDQKVRIRRTRPG